MKALVLEADKNLVYRDLPVPEIAGDECLVAVNRSGICNSDIARAYEGGAYFYPLVMGHEISGVVEESGPDVMGFKKGDRVAVFPLIPCHKCDSCMDKDYSLCTGYDYYGSRRNGGFSEFLAVKEWNLFRVPDAVSLDAAALLEPVSVGIHAARIPSVKKEDSIAVIGAGLIGLVIARHLAGAVGPKNVYVIDRNDFKLDIARGYGVKTINSAESGDWAATLRKETGGLNLVFEACGAVGTYRQSLEAAKNHGTVVLVGNIHGDLTLAKGLVSSVLRRELNIHGAWNSRFFHGKDDDWHHALEFLKRNPDTEKLISDLVPLSEGKSFFDRLYMSKSGRGKKAPILKGVFAV